MTAIDARPAASSIPSDATPADRSPQIMDASRVKARRLELGLSERKLAAVTGLGQAVVRNLEAGINHKDLTLGDLQRVADALALDIQQLLAGPRAPQHREALPVFGDALVRQLGALLYDVDRLIPVEALAEATSSTLEVTHQGLERLAVHLEPVGLRLHRLGNTVKIVRDVDAVSTDVLRRTWRRHLARRGLDTGQARLLHRVYTGQHGKTLSNNDQVTAAELVNARILDRTSAGGATLTDDVRYSLMVKP